MMLRKRSGPAQKHQSREQLMPESGCNSFFSLPGLFVGFTKGMADSDSARSPKSPLDYRVFSGFGSQFVRSPRSPACGDGARKRWDCDRVGLGLIGSLSEEGKPCGRVLLGSADSRINIPDRLLAVGFATSPKSLPKNYVISSHTRVQPPQPERGTQFEPRGLGKIQSFPSYVGSSSSLSSEVFHSEWKDVRLVPPPLVRGTNLGSSSGSLPSTHGFMASISASDIEQSEDYTCIISHGPIPKTTRIFGDCVLECCVGDDLSSFSRNKGRAEGRETFWMVECSEHPMSFPPEDFLKVCFSCKKKLEGKDIYMYRGEKAFCSCSCRAQQILLEEEMEGNPAIGSSGSARTSCCEEILHAGIVLAA